MEIHITKIPDHNTSSIFDLIFFTCPNSLTVRGKNEGVDVINQDI